LTQAWDFINADILWQTPQKPRYSINLDTPLENIKWGKRTGARILSMCSRHGHFDQDNWIEDPITTLGQLSQFYHIFPAVLILDGYPVISVPRTTTAILRRTKQPKLARSLRSSIVVRTTPLTPERTELRPTIYSS
jgi:hypothetical protein